MSLSEVLMLAPEDIKEALRSSGRPISMDAPLTQDEDSSITMLSFRPILPTRQGIT